MIVLDAIQKAFAEGYKNVLLEAPVGSGKSAIAVTCSNFYGTSHMITPRKSLQDQYLDDFGQEDLVLMKGRNAYPCTYVSSGDKKPIYLQVVNDIESGRPVRVAPGGTSCAEGPCKNNVEEFRKCTDTTSEKINDAWVTTTNDPCPYHVAVGVAQRSPAVIHNLHSFIFQANFAARFDERDLLVVDECHEMEGVVRGFAERTLIVKVIIPEADIPFARMKTLSDWVDWLRDNYAKHYSETNRMDGTSERGEFLQELLVMEGFAEKFGEKFTAGVDWRNDHTKYTRFTFTPVQVGHMINQYLLDYGTKRLLMSGTIYSKSQFCRRNGLVEYETCFIRIGSTFPVKNRPIIFKDQYKVDTSHKMWDANFREMIEKVETIMDVFDDAKGLIHTPSYSASTAILAALRGTERAMAHSKDDFQSQLERFYRADDHPVFLSPICQQGVDFKYDRARFQILLRVPFLNTSDSFVGYQVENDYPWYNHQALVNFGQMIGRVNRAPDDFGVTILMDERFGKFLSKNRTVLPKWLNDAIVTK